MNDQEFKNLEDFATRKLKDLPLTSAPADLIPNVLRMIQAAAVPVGFWAWSMPLRVLVTAGAILLASLSVFGAHALTNQAAVTYSQSSIPTVISSIGTLASAAIAAVKALALAATQYANSPWVWLAGGSVLALYVLIIASAALVIQLRKQYQTTL